MLVKTKQCQLLNILMTEMKSREIITFCVLLVASEARTIDVYSGVVSTQLSVLRSTLQGIEEGLGGVVCDVVWMIGGTGPFVNLNPPTTLSEENPSWFSIKGRSFCSLLVHDDVGIRVFQIDSERIMGGFAYHLIFTQNISELNIRNIRLLGNVLIASTQRNRLGAVYQRFYATSPSGSSFVAMNRPYFQPKTNFNGEQLIWVTTKNRHGPMHLLTKYRDSRQWLDMRLSILKAITTSLNATPFVLEFEESLGVDKKTGLTTGMIGGLKYGDGHISFFQMSLTIHQGIILGAYMITDGIAFVSRIPLRQRLPEAIQSIGGLFDADGWFLTGSVMVSVALVVSWGSDSGSRSLFSTLQQLLKPVGGQPFSNEFLRISLKFSSKLLLSFWLLLSMLLNSEIQTQMISSMTTPSYDIPPRTFQDLIGSDYNVVLGTSQGSITGQVLSRALDEAQFGIFRVLRMKTEKVLVGDIPKCLRATQLRPVVCLCQWRWGQHFSHMQLVNSNGEQLYRESDLMFPTYVVLGYNKGYPHIMDKANFMMFGYSEFGLLEYIMQRNIADELNTGRRNSVQRFKNGTQYPAELEITDVEIHGKTMLAGHFILCIFAGVIFISELAIHWFIKITRKPETMVHNYVAPS